MVQDERFCDPKVRKIPTTRLNLPLLFHNVLTANHNVQDRAKRFFDLKGLTSKTTFDLTQPR